MTPVMTPVTSSNIESIGYIAEKQELFVKFKNCKTFCYKDVSALEARELTKSVSVGKHFNQFIKAVKVGSEVADKEKIKLLREMLRIKLDLIRCGIGANYSGNPYENKLYTEAADLLEATKGDE